jgi:hypothetical protein
MPSAKGKSTYRRKISAEEVTEGYIFVTKDAVDFFPPMEGDFIITWPQGTGTVRLTSVPCSCVLPPHQHFRLIGDLPFRLAKGMQLEIRRMDDDRFEGEGSS